MFVSVSNSQLGYLIIIATAMFVSSCKEDILTAKLLTAKLSGEMQDVLERPYQAFKISDGPALYMRMSEVTVVEYCEFLNSIKYSHPPVNVVSFQFAEGDEMTGVARGEEYRDCFLVEHDESNIVRHEGKFSHGVKSDEEEAVNCVTFYGAIAFCRWLSEKTGVPIDLPTETEWHGFAIALRNSGKSAAGCPGGVWEWCLDRFDPDHKFRFEEKYNPFVGESDRRVVRGGQYFSRRNATVFDRAGSLELSGGANEQGYGFRPIIRHLNQESPDKDKKKVHLQRNAPHRSSGCGEFLKLLFV